MKVTNETRREVTCPHCLRVQIVDAEKADVTCIRCGLRFPQAAGARRIERRSS